MKSFLKNIVDPIFATDHQRKTEIWDVEGRLKNGNQPFKFDIRPLRQVANKAEKIGYFKSKSDKMVFETTNQWVIFDTEELNEYVKSKDKKDVNVDELLNNLSWNLILDKVE